MPACLAEGSSGFPLEAGSSLRTKVVPLFGTITAGRKLTSLSTSASLGAQGQRPQGQFPSPVSAVHRTPSCPNHTVDALSGLISHILS